MRSIGDRQVLLVERQRRYIAAALLCRLRPCVVDADLTHRAAGDRKKVSVVVPLRTRGAEKLEIGLVHERRGLERVPGTDTSELAMGQRSQFSVDDRKQPIERVAVSFADRDQ